MKKFISDKEEFIAGIALSLIALGFLILTRDESTKNLNGYNLTIASFVTLLIGIGFKLLSSSAKESTAKRYLGKAQSFLVGLSVALMIIGIILSILGLFARN